MNTSGVRRIALHETKVSDKTRWVFVHLEAQDGLTGCGEATLNGKEDLLRAVAPALVARVFETATQRPEAYAQAVEPAGLEQAAIISAIDQALWDLRSAAQGKRLADALGGARRESIAIYANINRRTEVRTPESFASSARAALATGFTAFKLAPFDEVTTARSAGAGEYRDSLQAGLDRIAAVRAAIGPERRLMVDCHWRFDEAGAHRLLDAAADFGLYWVECPIPEVDANIAALVGLRKRANDLGVRLAGLEQAIRFDAFRPYCEAGAYDVMMPDVKYIGGLQEMLACAAALARYGIDVSPHNPSGPISHAASLHVAAAMDTVGLLEVQFDETPLFDSLATGLPPRLAGQSALPQGRGLGVRIDPQQFAAHAARDPCIWEAP